MLAMKISKWMRFRHEAPRFLFSTNLSQLGQRAVWAYKIGEQIKKAQPSKDYSDTLLRKILNLEIQGTPFKFSPQLKKESLKMFTEGIELDQTCFSQTQIKFADQQDNKFIFFPSYLVTPTIFQILAKTDYNQMIFGGYGIGKTISIILYCQLYIPLHKYFYQAKYDQNIKIQLQKLKESNLISNVPKYFYWSISLFKPKSISLQEIVFAQTTQMRPNHRQAIKEHINDPKQFKKKLGQFLSKTQIKTFCVIDQINMAASCVRQWNLQVQIRRWKNFNITSQQFCDLLQKELKQGQDENFSKLNNLAQQIQKKITQFKYYGWYCVFSSSINIQKSLLEDPPFEGKKRLTLKIWDHQQAIFNCKIRSSQYLNRPEGQNQFYNFLWFEIWRNLKDRQIQTKLIQNLKQYFEGKRHEIKINKYARFLNIRQTVQQIFMNKDLFSPSHQNLTAFVDYVLQKFAYVCLQNERTRMNRFLDNGDKLTKQLRANFINTIFILSLLQADQTVPLSFQKLQIESITGYSSILRDYLRSHQQNRSFIPIQIHDGKINFFYTASQFIDVARTDTITNTSQSFIDQLPKRRVSNPSTLENIFKGIISEALMVSEIVTFNDEEDRKLYFSIAQVQQFQDFNKKTFTTKEKFKQMLTIASDNPNKSILAFPKNEKKQREINNDGISIDLFFVQYNSKIKKYKIQTVDVTTGVKKLKRNGQAFNKLFSRIIPSKFQWKHMIVAFSSQQQQIEKSLKAQDVNRAFFSSIEKIQIINYTSTEKSQFCVKRFLQFRKLLVKIKNSKILDK